MQSELRDDESPRAAERRVYGDVGAWYRHLATAWRAAAAPQLADDFPVDPTSAFARERAARPGSMPDTHLDVVAYWSPILHLLTFGLGWRRVDTGLTRWLDMGCPTEDPVLAVVSAWWPRERIEDFLAFCQGDFPDLVEARAFRLAGHEPPPSRIDGKGRWALRQERSEWQAVWSGGSDPLHLTLHLDAPLAEPPRGLFATPLGLGSPQRQIVLSERYVGWYTALRRLPARSADGRSLRTDVVCKPIGWLGEYRQSRETGAWFRGRHRWHVLGH